jgi:dihydroflavonol-4-reductase
MRAVVVGGSGFLGLNIIEALLAAGHEVVATRRPSSNTIFLRRMKVPMVRASLEDPDSLAAAMDGADVAYFAAAHYPRFSVDTEAQVASAVAGARNVVRAAVRAGVGRLIYTGSVVTVGQPENGGPARETDGEANIPAGSTYFAVKRAVERELMERPDLDIIHLLPTGCLGPYDHKVGTGFFVVGLATGRLSVFTDGRINMVDARDVGRAHVVAAEVGRPHERYILGGHNITAGELLAEVAAALGATLPASRLSAEEAVALATTEEERCLREGGKGRPALSREIVDMIVHGQWVDSTKAQEELGLEPRPLAETIEASRRWYSANGYLQKG